MSILDYYPITTKECEKNMLVVNNLVEGDALLSGLRLDAKPISIPVPSVVTTSTMYYDLCVGSEESEDIEDYHDDFVSIAAQSRMSYIIEFEKSTPTIVEEYKKSDLHYDVYLREKVTDLVYSDSIRERIKMSSADDPIGYEACANLVFNETSTYIVNLVRSCYNNGLVEDAFYARMLTLFQAGGLPCGWLGVEPTPEKLRSTEACNQCMQVFYLG